jgi:putative transposase
LSDDDWPRPRSATPSRSGARQGRFCTRTAAASFGSKKVRRLLDNNDLVGSMGRDGAACDNAAMESFFSPLQKNVPDTRRRETREELRLAIAREDRF